MFPSLSFPGFFIFDSVPFARIVCELPRLGHFSAWASPVGRKWIDPIAFSLRTQASERVHLNILLYQLIGLCKMLDSHFKLARVTRIHDR